MSLSLEGGGVRNFLAISAVLNLVSISCHWIVGKRYFTRDGYRNGYRDGRKDADNWWIEVERGIDREREKIWKEEL